MENNDIENNNIGNNKIQNNSSVECFKSFFIETKML